MGGMIELAEVLADFGTDADAVSGAAGIFSFLEVSADFDVSPEKAISYFKRKGLTPTFSYADMIGEAHDQAFTVAKMMDVDLLGQVRASFDSAMAVGVPMKQWAQELMPMLQKAGWWGVKEVVDPKTNEVLQAQLGSPWRLETIFRTNMQAAYSQGHWAEIEANADVAPFVMYDAIDDFRTRPSHKARDGTVLRWDHPWWRTNCPPLGYNCRCGVIQLSESDLRGMGLEVTEDPPDFPRVEWKNPRTGEPSSWPEGVDPGFGRKPTQVDPAREALTKKIAELPPDMKAAAESATTPSARASAVIHSVGVATKEISAAAGASAALRESTRRARQEEKQVAAQIQLEALADSDDFVKQAVDELSRDPAWRAMPAEDRLLDAKRRAREIQRGA